MLVQLNAGTYTSPLKVRIGYGMLYFVLARRLHPAKNVCKWLFRWMIHNLNRLLHVGAKDVKSNLHNDRCVSSKWWSSVQNIKHVCDWIVTIMSVQFLYVLSIFDVSRYVIVLTFSCEIYVYACGDIIIWNFVMVTQYIALCLIATSLLFFLRINSYCM